jgi:hypothetical protein
MPEPQPAQADRNPGHQRAWTLLGASLFFALIAALLSLMWNTVNLIGDSILDARPLPEAHQFMRKLLWHFPGEGGWVGFPTTLAFALHTLGIRLLLRFKPSRDWTLPVWLGTLTLCMLMVAAAVSFASTIFFEHPRVIRDESAAERMIRYQVTAATLTLGGVALVLWKSMWSKR